MGDPGPNNRWRAVRDRRKKMSATIKVSVLMDRRAALLAGLVVGEREVIEAGPDSIGPELWPVLVGRLDMDACPPVLERTGLVAAPTVEALVAVLRAEQQAASAEATKKEEEKRLTEEAVAAVMSQPFISQLRYTHDPWDCAWDGVARCWAGVNTRHGLGGPRWDFSRDAPGRFGGCVDTSRGVTTRPRARQSVGDGQFGGLVIGVGGLEEGWNCHHGDILAYFVSGMDNSIA